MSLNSAADKKHYTLIACKGTEKKRKKIVQRNCFNLKIREIEVKSLLESQENVKK